MTLFDQAVLLLTGLTAIYITFRLWQEYQAKSEKPVQNIYYMLSFIVLLVAGLLLIFFKTWDVLNHPFILVVAYIIPLGLSLGLVTEFYNNYSKMYLVFGAVGLVLIILTKGLGMGSPGIKAFTSAIFHSVGGMIIFFVPVLAVKSGKAPSGFVFVTIGALLIGLGGVALAFLKGGGQLLFFSADFVFMILSPLLLLMTLSFTYGFMKKISASK
jgi:hypothetical protein